MAGRCIEAKALIVRAGSWRHSQRSIAHGAVLGGPRGPRAGMGHRGGSGQLPSLPSLKRRSDRPEGQAAQTSRPSTSALTTLERRLAI
jgi:hypothetical protein